MHKVTLEHPILLYYFLQLIPWGERGWVGLVQLELAQLHPYAPSYDVTDHFQVIFIAP